MLYLLTLIAKVACNSQKCHGIQKRITCLNPATMIYPCKSDEYSAIDLVKKYFNFRENLSFISWQCNFIMGSRSSNHSHLFSEENLSKFGRVQANDSLDTSILVKFHKLFKICHQKLISPQVCPKYKSRASFEKKSNLCFKILHTRL